MPLCNCSVVPSEGKSGGLWLLWGDGIKVGVISQCKNFIAAEVDSRDGSPPWLLVAVYGDPARIQNPVIWSQLESIIVQQRKPTCLVGDFNTVSYPHEKAGGSQNFGDANRAFRDWIHSMELMDLGYHGPAYTWSNKQGGSQDISQRLDHALANIDWTLTWPDTAVFHLPRFQSDHLPILVRTKPTSSRARNVFKCENWWMLKEGFQEVCSRAASKGGANWCNTQKALRYEVKEWLAKESSPDVMLKKVRGENANSKCR